MESSGLSTFGPKIGERLLLLLAAVCLAVSSLFATQGKTPPVAPKPAAHPLPSHPATNHPVANKTGAPVSASHPASKARGIGYAAQSHAAAGKPGWHPSNSAATRTTANRSTAYAVQHNSSAAARNRNAHPTAPWALTGMQRLSRLHLAPERVQEIQQALIREGYFEGEPTGEWDSRTRDAMLRYQTMHGFPPTGLPEAKSLMKLGLGPHPLPADLDHGEVGVATPGAMTSVQNVFTVSPTVAPDAPASPRNLNTAPPEIK
jgi:hypothetical protein